jgi:hypothetical protein
MGDSKLCHERKQWLQQLSHTSPSRRGIDVQHTQSYQRFGGAIHLRQDLFSHQREIAI